MPYQFLISYIQISLKQLTFMAHNNEHAEEYYHIHVYCILINRYSQDDVKEKRRTKMEEIDMPRAL